MNSCQYVLIVAVSIIFSLGRNCFSTPLTDLNKKEVSPQKNILEDEEIYSCVKCLCDIDRGWWTKNRCAPYPFPQHYWRKAHRKKIMESPFNMTSYEECATNEYCIARTIIEYTQSFGQVDCNCDGKFDCQDRSAIHLFGKDCYKYFTKYSNWFAECWKHIGINAAGVRTSCPRKTSRKSF